MSPRLLFLNEDARVLDMIRRGDERALAQLYESNRKMIASFVARNNGTHDDYEDLLQEALIIVWERVRMGRFEYSSKLSTFIFGTVKNIWLRRLARARREAPADSPLDDHADTQASALDDLIETEESNAVKLALEKIGGVCRELLVLFYWEQTPMEEIARKLGFANAETAKSKKYQCKKSLQRILKQTLDQYA